MSKVAVVGFGRIGRSAVKAGLSAKLFTPSVIADIVSADAMAPLFEFDSNYGRWRDPVSVESDGLVIGDATISWIDARQSAPDWKALGVDLVLDCTGRATTRAGARGCVRGRTAPTHAGRGRDGPPARSERRSRPRWRRDRPARGTERGSGPALVGRCRRFGRMRCRRLGR